MKLETFSYLPALTTQQILRQVHYLLQQGLVPAIEYGEIEACKAANPRCYIKLIGYDRRRQTQAVSFVVQRPEAARSGP
jgi:ribulose-bisphosphate carboxylase small chain